VGHRDWRLRSAATPRLHYLRDTWQICHDGTLSTLVALAAHLVHTAHGSDAAVFSCDAGAVKPDQRLYGRISDESDVSSGQTLDVGDASGGELRGALAAGMAAVAVRRRGPADALAFGDIAWSGPILDAMEQVPAYLAGRA
jgi:hypothetical protein